jgi:DNA-binding IclR family transcriptional regulator
VDQAYTQDASAELSRREPAGTSTLSLALRIVEFLAFRSQPVALLQIAQEFGASKATVYRHLVTLQRHGFVRQEASSGRYEAGVKLMVLGEAQRSRFGIVAVARSALMNLRDQTGQAVTLCTVVDAALVVLELVQGRTIIDFSTRPGTQLDFHASAHGKIWLGFGPAAVTDAVAKSTLTAWTAHTLTDHAALAAEIATVRTQGWSTAPDQVLTGVNTIAAPVFDHNGHLIASIAIVGSTQFIPAAPDAAQWGEVVACARRISTDLGWRP